MNKNNLDLWVNKLKFLFEFLIRLFMSAIDIKTTQNVTIQYELASLRDRFFAIFIDFIIVFTASFLIIIFLSSLISSAEVGRTGEEGSSGFALQILMGLLPIVGFMVYQFLSELITSGQTWGKKALGIKTIRLDGKEASISDYLLRAIFHLVDTFFSFGVIAALLISASVKRQRFGDLTANTTVVRLQNSTKFYLEEILKINTLENYTPSYPQVKELTEKDMLLIRNAINRYRLYPNEAHKKAINQLVDNLVEPLNLSNSPKDKVNFLKTLIRDYIVLTR